MKNNVHNNDDGAVERLNSVQNRVGFNHIPIESADEFLKKQQLVNKTEDEISGAGNANGAGTGRAKQKPGKKGLVGILGKLKKIKLFLFLGGFGVVLLIFVIIAAIFTNETWKGNFLAGKNIDFGISKNGSTSNSRLTDLQRQTTTAAIWDYYESSSTKAQSFFLDLSNISSNYNSYPYTAEEFDIAMIASAIHYNKFISDATIIRGAMSGKRSYSNMGIARSRSMAIIPSSEIKGFYELSSVSLGTDIGVSDIQLKGLVGNLVGSRIVSKCVPSSQASDYYFRGTASSGSINNIIKKYEDLYYPESEYGLTYSTTENVNGVQTEVEKNTRLSSVWDDRLSTYKSKGVFNDYYDTSMFDGNMSCASGQTLVHYLEKYMNYPTFAKYLLTEFIPENYIECVDCSSNNKKSDTVHVALNIFANRNNFASFFYNDVIDTNNFVSGDSYTITEAKYQLPEFVAENFGSPYDLTSSCTISSPFTSNRSGYSHFAVDSYASNTQIFASYDGEVVAAVSGIPNIYDSWNGGACVTSGDIVDGRSSGNYVTIKHNIDGVIYYSSYMHLSKLTVGVGDIVKKGDLVGHMGNTGCSSGAHLHFQLRSSGIAYDPSALFAQCDGVSIKNFDPQTLEQYLYSIFPTYTYTNEDECIIRTYVNEEGKKGDPYYTLSLEEYVAGVLTIETSASAPFESTKALAIAARTEVVNSTNYCSSENPVENSSRFQNYGPIDMNETPSDIINVLAARETQGMLITYSYGIYATEYASFPCEIAFSCEDVRVPMKDGTFKTVQYRPKYFADEGEKKLGAEAYSKLSPQDKVQANIKCVVKEEVDRYNVHPDFSTMVSNLVKGDTLTDPKLEGKCGGVYANGSMKGSVYYCSGTNIPRQFAEELGISCDEIQVDLMPNSGASSYRALSIPLSRLGSKVGSGFSNHHGHNRGMSQVLAQYLAVENGWDYRKIIDYFYTGDGIIEEGLINIDTPIVFVDEISEYEAGYSESCGGTVTVNVKDYKYLPFTVPIDFAVAGNLAASYGVGAGNSIELLKAQAVASRTYLYTRSWSNKDIFADHDSNNQQYDIVYTDSKTIYDAVNATKNEVIVDTDGYLFPTLFSRLPEVGTSSNGQTELIMKYILNDQQHRIKVPTSYIDGLVAGDPRGMSQTVAQYLIKNWYLVDYNEVLQYFYSQDAKIVDISNLGTVGAVKELDGSITGTGAYCDYRIEALDASLEEYVTQAGKGTLNGVLAAAYWLFVHSRADIGDVEMPYQMAGEYQKIGVDPEWGKLKWPDDPDYKYDGLDCVGFVRWAFVNGYFKFPKEYRNGSQLFVYQDMQKYVESNKLVCTDEGDSCYIEFEESSVKRRGVPLTELFDKGWINPGDVLYHYKRTVYTDDPVPTPHSHIGIVYDIDKVNRTITIIHSTGFLQSDQKYSSGATAGIAYFILDVDTGKYNTGSQHGFTSIIRMSEMELRGYLE